MAVPNEAIYCNHATNINSQQDISKCNFRLCADLDQDE